jgi:YVTN family beta-propeller protein
VTSRDNDKLFVYNGQTMAQVGQVPVCDEPFGVDVNWNTNKVYVACYASNQVYVVDGASLAVLGQIGVGVGPTYVAVNPDTNRIYVALHGSNGVTVIDGATDVVTNIIGAGAGTFGIAVNRSLNRVYVSNRDVNSITTIDGATNHRLDSQTVHLSPARSVPFELDYNEGSGKLYVVYGPHNIPNKVWVYQASASGLLPLTSIDVGDGGSDGGGGIAANSSTNHIFVTNSAENSISVISGATDSVLWTIYHPAVTLQDPFGIAVDNALNLVYVVNRAGNSVSRFPDY